MGTIITEASALAAIDAAIELKGADYVYESGLMDAGEQVCVYFDAESKPSCIVGHVLASHGYGPGTIREGDTPTSVHSTGGIVEHRDILHALTRAQASQDSGDTWQDTREAFIDELKFRDTP